MGRIEALGVKDDLLRSNRATVVPDTSWHLVSLLWCDELLSCVIEGSPFRVPLYRQAREFSDRHVHDTAHLRDEGLKRRRQKEMSVRSVRNEQNHSTGGCHRDKHKGGLMSEESGRFNLETSGKRCKNMSSRLRTLGRHEEPALMLDAGVDMRRSSVDAIFRIGVSCQAEISKRKLEGTCWMTTSFRRASPGMDALDPRGCCM